MIRNTALLAVFLTAYFLAVIFNVSYLAMFFAPLNTYMAAGILLFAYIKSDRSNKAGITFLLYSFACFSWAVGDTFWGILTAVGKGPSNNTIVAINYLLTNVFILLAIVTFAMLQFSKWNRLLLFIDSFIVSVIAFMMIWVLYLHKEKEILTAMLRSDYSSIFCLSADIVILIGVVVWFVSIRLDKIPAFMWIMSAGVVVFSATDMLYYYTYFQNSYIPDSAVDFLYIFAMDIIAFGALWKTCRSGSGTDISFTSNTGASGKWSYILFALFVLVPLAVAKTANIELGFSDVAFLTLLVFLYKASRQYVQVSLENERLLVKEKEYNKLLEERVAEQVKELMYLANQDTMTSMFNRRYFIKTLGESIESLRSKETLALALIDLDRFKQINDRFGHDCGDKVLIEISRRMLGWRKEGTTFSRLGGDEFAVLFVGEYTQKEIEDSCMEILGFCSEPIEIGGEIFHVTLSMGISVLGDDGEDMKTLMKNADIAMYHAKSQGYNKYQFYDPFLSEDLTRRSQIEFLLKRADIDKEFELFFQPKVTLPDMKLAGAEALIRWKNPEHGYIPPGVFIPVAEEIDYILPLGKWVIRETIKQAMDWENRYRSRLKISFNISPRQLSDDSFIDYLKSLVVETGVDPSCIGAEITENILLNDESRVDELFVLLEDLGIAVSLDDFGSGYSSLGYLSKYQFDKIKIDRVLIDNISSDNIAGQNVVKAAIEMAKANGLKVIAEGVESQEQVDILMELGCDQIQGYLPGRPVPGKVFEEKFLQKIELFQ